MPLEEQRKKLMGMNHDWGQHPGSQASHVKRVPVSRDESNLDDHSTDDEEGEVIYDMNKVVEPSPNPPKCRISTIEWSFHRLLQSSKNFRPVPRIPATSSRKSLGQTLTGYEKEGIPAIIDGWDKLPSWPREIFNIESFSADSPADIDVRNVHDWTDRTIPLSDFLAKSRVAPISAYPEENERLYGKDAHCPKAWNKWLHEAHVIPASLLPDGSTNLLLNQPRSSPVETLMCYLGIGDTFTPCHKDLCASSGQNLMCYAEKNGSSFWFMTRSSDAPRASTYFQELGQELDHETYVITVKELANAPFDIYIAEQRMGDLVLVPPRSCHQVVNRGGLTIKTSWSRMTMKGLELAYYHELPIYRRVCRPEIYRVQSTIHYTLLRMTAELESIAFRQTSPGPFDAGIRSKTLVTDMRRLLRLFDSILINEYAPNSEKMGCLSLLSSAQGTVSPAPSNTSSATLIPNEKEAEGGYVPVTCDFCGADIFQSFFECRTCVDRRELRGRRSVMAGDGYMVCAGCYSEGRSCKCRKMTPMQCRPFKELLEHRRKACIALHSHTGDDSLLDRLQFSSTIGTFKAACQLQRTRSQKGTMRRTCTLSGAAGTSHSIDTSFGLFCKGCHSSKCFMHILKMYKIHSVEAILRQAADESHQEYHKCHLTNKVEYKRELNNLLSSQSQGSRPNPLHHRVHVALTYGSCKPVNSAYAGLGWYDIYAQMHQEPEDISDEPSSPSQGRGHSISPHALRTPTPQPHRIVHGYMSNYNKDKDIPGSLIAVPSSDNTSKTLIARPTKRKRHIFECVEIPSQRLKIAAAAYRSTSVTSQPTLPTMLKKIPLGTVAAHTDMAPSAKICLTNDAHGTESIQNSAPDTSTFNHPPSIHRSGTTSNEVIHPISLPQPSGRSKIRLPTHSISTAPPLIPPITFIDHERSGDLDQTRPATPPPTSNPHTYPRFNNISSERSSLPSTSGPHPEGNGDQLAQVFNATALHNHTMNLNTEHDGGYLIDKTHINETSNSTHPPTHTPANGSQTSDELSHVKEENHWLRQQISSLTSHLSYHLVQKFWSHLTGEGEHPEQPSIHQHHGYPDKFQEYVRDWHPTANIQGTSRNLQHGHTPQHRQPEIFIQGAYRNRRHDQIPQDRQSTVSTKDVSRDKWRHPMPHPRGQRLHTRHFKRDARRHSDPPHPSENHRRAARPYEYCAPEPHPPRAPRNFRSSGPSRATRGWRNTPTVSSRPLQRLSYERSEVLEPIQSTEPSQPSHAVDLPTIIDIPLPESHLENTPITQNFQGHPSEFQRSAILEVQGHIDSSSRSESASSEIWEDTYELSSSEPSNGHVFKDSTIPVVRASRRPSRWGPPISQTSEDPTHNPWK